MAKTKEAQDAFCSALDLRDALNGLLSRGEDLIETAKGLEVAMQGNCRPSNDDYLAVYGLGGECSIDFNPELSFALESLRYFWEAKREIDNAIAAFDFTLTDDATKPLIDRWSTQIVGELLEYAQPIVGTRAIRSKQLKHDVDLPRFVRMIAEGFFPDPQWQEIEPKLKDRILSLEAVIPSLMRGNQGKPISPSDQKIAYRNEWFYEQRRADNTWRKILDSHRGKFAGCEVDSIDGVRRGAEKHATSIGEKLQKGVGGRPKQKK